MKQDSKYQNKNRKNKAGNRNRTAVRHFGYSPSQIELKPTFIIESTNVLKNAKKGKYVIHGKPAWWHNVKKHQKMRFTEWLDGGDVIHTT